MHHSAPRLHRSSLLSALALCAACSDYGFSGAKPGEVAETGSCADLARPDDYDVAQDDACVTEPAVGSFAPVVEWQWSSNPVHDGFDDIMASPVVGNLTDDDGDGDIDEDDIPDICFTSFAGGAYTSAGTLTCISGDGAGTHWSLTDAGGHALYGSGGVAIGDLDGDGRPEVCAAGTAASVVCVQGDGGFAWAGGTEPGYVACPAISDMDGDGLAEVAMGREILAHDGSVRVVGDGSSGTIYKMSVPVDMDGDGQQELVAGNTVYRLDGSALWSAAVHDGIPAIGDFDLDGRPDVVLGGGGLVTLLGNDGSVMWSVSVAGGGSGGAPTVADFDGDGWPEVGVAGASTYSVYETDGSTRWSMPVSDYSSNVTGSSVFDFEGDGAAEVVYADEHTLWVYDGATGAVELEESGHASGTLYEYPLVADVDADGSTEIVLASNNYGYDGWNGITVIGDEASSWAPARPVWNQFAYHITNVDNDGGIPAEPVDNWLTWNNFRAGGTELGPSHWLADLAPDDPAVCVETCAADEVTLYLPVENGGLLDTRGFAVTLVGADDSIVWAGEVDALPAGRATWLGPVTLRRAQWGEGELRVQVDADAEVGECREADNWGFMGAWPCE